MLLYIKIVMLSYMVISSIRVVPKATSTCLLQIVYTMDHQNIDSFDFEIRHYSTQKMPVKCNDFSSYENKNPKSSQFCTQNVPEAVCEVLCSKNYMSIGTPFNKTP